jgi:general secretion pathway protein A
MYNTFFGFREKPFKLVPNPDYLFLSKSHEIALAHLTYAREQGEGFVVITGEVGTGKTTLCRNFLEGLDERTESAYIFNPHMQSDQLLSAICHEFGVAVQDAGTQALLDAFYGFLIGKHAAGIQVVLVIDEAQGLSIENLELVRMLSNLETTRNKLLQIVLVGQPELDDKLESHELRQLAQRISLSYHLSPLSAKDTQAYICHRLSIAAQRQADFFTTDACRLAYRFSGGIPRLINIICDRALLTAYSHNRPRVTRGVMQAAIAEMTSRGRINPAWRRWSLWLGAGVCLLALAVVVAVLTTHFNPGWFAWAKRPASAGASSSIQPTTNSRVFKIPDPTSTAPQPVPAQQATSSDGDSRRLSTDGSAVNPGPQAKEPSDSRPIPVFSAQPAPSGKAAESGSTAIDQWIGRLTPETSRKRCIIKLLSTWRQPRPDIDMIPTSLEDSRFIEIAARQYGLRSYAVRDNWSLVRNLNLPCIVALKQGNLIQPVYIVLVGRSDRSLYFEDGESATRMETQMDAIKPYLAGPVYLFWKNAFGYDMTIGFGSDYKAVREVKNLLRQVGYAQLDQSSVFNRVTEQAVKDFQARHQLQSDGLVGSLTKIVLLQEAGSVQMPTLTENEGPPS